MRVETGKSVSDRTGSGALVVGGLAAILASACCLGPLVLVALGLSGAWIGTLRYSNHIARFLSRALLWLCCLLGDASFGGHPYVNQMVNCAQRLELVGCTKSYSG